MKTAGQEVGKHKTQLRQLGGKLVRMVAKTDEVGAGAQEEYRACVEHMKDKHTAVQARLDSYRSDKGAKWEYFKGGVETTWQDLANAFRAVRQ